MVEGQREEMEECMRVVLDVAGEVQSVRDALMATLILSS
jgi:hypothetical protein